MTLKTSFFDKTIFTKTMKRFWPLWLAYLAVWVLALPVNLYDTFHWRDVVDFARMQRDIFDLTQYASPIISFIAAPIAAMAVFSHLYNDRSCGAYASLPIRRESMFLSVALAGLVPLLFANVVVFGSILWTEASLGCMEWTAALTWLGTTSLHLITFYGFAVLCAQLTGQTMVVPAVYLVLSFTALAVQYVLQGLFQLFLYGYSHSGIFLTWLSPVVQLCRSLGYEVADYQITAIGGYEPLCYTFHGWGVSAIYAASGLVCGTVALLLHRKRKMETAGDTVAVRSLKPVFKYCLALACAMVVGVVLCSMFYKRSTQTVWGMPRLWGVGLCVLIGGFVGYFAAEMINRKSFRVFDRGWKGFGVFLAAALLLLCALEFDFFGYEKYIPKAEKIENISMYVGGYNGRNDKDADVDMARDLHQKLLDIQPYSESEEGYNENAGYLQFYYTLKNGRTVSRDYRLPVLDETKDAMMAIEDYFNSAHVRAQKGFSHESLTPDWFDYCNFHGRDVDVALTPTEAYEFYTNYLLPDMREGKISRFWLTDDSIYAQEEYDCWIELSIRNPLPKEDNMFTQVDGYEYLYVRVTTESERVLSWLGERGVTPKMPVEYDEYAEKYGNQSVTSFPSTSVGVIGSADGPTSIIVSQ